MILEFLQREEERFDKIASQKWIDITRMEVAEKIRILAMIDKSAIELENLTPETVSLMKNIKNECKNIT